MFETIVWATDGSAYADRALPYVKDLASTFDSAVVVVHCAEFLVGPRATGQPVHVDEEELQAKIKGQVEELGSAGVRATWKLVGGSTLEGAAQLIANAAREADADLVIVGTRGRTQLAGLLVGAVTQRLLHISPAPVLAVPARVASTADDAAVTAAPAAR